MGPKSMIKPSDNKPKKSTVQFLEKPASKILDKSSKLSHSKTQDSKKNKLHGGISVKDDPDKIDKEEYESGDEEDKDDKDEDDENKEEDGEEEEEEEEEEVEKEEFDKEKDEDEEGGEGDGDECVYRLTKKKNTIDVEIEEGEDNFEDDDIQNDNKSNYVKNSERKTKPFLFDFERVRLLGERARQLSLGAKPMIKNIENMDPKVVAKLELEKKIIPLIILRELPNGLIEKWKVSELSY
jgi:DNA-directed RNA polymerase subunit K/omega